MTAPKPPRCEHCKDTRRILRFDEVKYEHYEADCHYCAAAVAVPAEPREKCEHEYGFCPDCPALPPPQLVDDYTEALAATARERGLAGETRTPTIGDIAERYGFAPLSKEQQNRNLEDEGAGETRTEAQSEKNLQDAIRLVNRCLNALYLEVEPSIANDIVKNVNAALVAAASRIAQLEQERLESLKRAERESQLAILLANELVKHDSGEFHSSLTLNPETNGWSRK